MTKNQWNQYGARVLLFSEGEGAEDLLALVQNGLHSDYYSALAAIKENINLGEKFGGLEFVLAVLANDKVYCIVAGGAGLYLVRNGTKAPLLKTLKNTSSVVSGQIHTGDVFEVETASSKETFSQELSSGDVSTSAASKGDRISNKLANAIDNVLARLPERKLVVHGDDDGKSKRARKASLIGIGFLVILAISIYFGVNRRQKQVAIQEYEPALLAAIHDLDEALELAPLSHSRARELILSSRNEASRLTNEGIEDERLTKLNDDLSRYLGEIAGIYDDAAEVYLDLGIISSGFEASDLSFSDGLLRVLDSKNRKLVGIETSNKRTNIISGPDYLPDAIATTAYADRSFILSSDGIREVTEEVGLVVKPDGWDADNVLVAAFAGNLYVLDRGGDQIWRYAGVRGGFLEKEEWLGEGFTRNTGDADFMAIDGSIWTLSRSGKFTLYSLGAPASFSVSGETSPISEVSGFYTDEESQYIYILDKGNSRIAVVKKNGEYVSEYSAPELAGAIDLVVDEENRLILFLANSKLYKLEARHLEDTGDESS